MRLSTKLTRGLEYLHEHCNPPVIHRDLKSSNILLDSDFNAKISDFGLAVTSGNHSKGSLKLSGTLGYVAPEYLLDGKLTEKSDVYAFGVVLLELLLGRRPVEKTAQSQCQSIVTWVPNILILDMLNLVQLKNSHSLDMHRIFLSFIS
jgi:serine/threonine protein kinase